MANEVQLIKTTAKVFNLRTYAMNAAGFNVEVYTSTTPTAANGSRDTKVAEKILGGHKDNVMFVSDEFVFTGLTKQHYYIFRYQISYPEGTSSWYEEEEKIGDSSVAAILSNKGVVYDGVDAELTASFTVNDLPSDYNEIHWYVRNTTKTISSDIIPNHITESLTYSNPSADFELTIPVAGNKYIYALVVDHSYNKHAATAELIGTDPMSAPADPVFGTPVITGISSRFPLSSAEPTNFYRYEWHWDTNNSAPTSNSDVMLESSNGGLVIPTENIENNNTIYVWVRAVTRTLTRSNWVSHVEDVSQTTVPGNLNIKDVLVFR